MVDTAAAIAIVTLAVAVVALLWILLRRSQAPASDTVSIESVLTSLKAEMIQKQMDGLVSLRESLDSANSLMNDRLAQGQTALDRRLEVLGEIENRLGQLTTQTEHLEKVGENISALSDLLKPPKLRGNLGELLLEHLLGQILPDNLYSMQHTFANGSRVDAVIHVGDQLLPVDSKFPLDSFERLAADETSEAARKEFQKSLKKHVDDIAGKYLRPTENTTDFAVMYIPSEAVYYQFVSQIEGSSFEYALTRRVIPSSPGHLYAFLASLASLYQHLGLTSSGEILAESRRLTAGLQVLSESVAKVLTLEGRIESSLRSATGNVEKIKSECVAMTGQLDRLRRSEPDT